MSFESLANVSNSALWNAVEPDGVSPSATLSVTPSLLQHPLIAGAALRISGGAGALGHRVRIDPGGVDLTASDQVRLLWRPSVPAGLQSGAPFWAELRMGSVALPAGAPGNDWHRRIPAAAPARWETVGISLDGLAPMVRSAVSDLQIICIDDGRAFTADIAAVLAGRPALPEDVETALTARLDQRLMLGGAAVPAEVQRAGVAPAPTRPLIAILPYQIRHARERASPAPSATDFVTDGYSLRPPPTPWDLQFAIEALAETRAEQAAMIDFVIEALPPVGALLVAGRSVSIEVIDEPELASGGFDIERQLLHYRVRGWRDGGPVRPVRPVDVVDVEVDTREMSNG
jgi:hypothetical protein